MIYNIDGLSRTIELVEEGGYKKEVKEIKHDKSSSLILNAKALTKQ